jgi:dihydropteroate synthase
MSYALPKTKIMAILNLTPDSFSDGGRLMTIDAALRSAEHALAAGATILDVGGESTRPGATTVDASVEMQRVLPVITAIHQRFPEALMSVDTRKAKVAQAALEAGARWINDVSGLQFDEQMAETVARYDATLILMHSQGTPQNMQKDPQYPEGIMPALLNFFHRQIKTAQQAGISLDRLILDPGFGFGKNLHHNLEIQRNLDVIQSLGLPILMGTSRKSFLTMGNRDINVLEREALTAVSLAMAVQKGVTYVRVHDVETHAPVLRLAEALQQPAVEMKEPKLLCPLLL